MTIEQIANRIIKAIKAWPEEAKQSQEDGGPKTSWDEYKEQIQYEEYDSFEVYEETIVSMVEDEVSELSEKVIDNLYRSRHNHNFPATAEEKREDIIDSVLYYIKSKAESQDIEYNKPYLDYIRYYADDLEIVAEVIKQISPEEYLIHSYSKATSELGEQGVSNLSYLDEDCGLERITQEEFEKGKRNFNAENVLEEQAENSEGTTTKNCGRDEGRSERDQTHKVTTEMSIEESDISSKKVFNDTEKKVAIESQKTIRDNLPIGLNSEIIQAGMGLAAFYIKAGARSFVDYAKHMVADMGPNIKPYLKCFYNTIRDWPGFDADRMDTYETVYSIDIEKIIVNNVGEKCVKSKYQDVLSKSPLVKEQIDNQKSDNSDSIITPNSQVTDIDGNIYTTIKKGTQE